MNTKKSGMNEEKKSSKNGGLVGILVDWQIKKLREQKLIGIEPFDERFLEPATYDLRVGGHAAVSTASRPIDLKKSGWLIIEPGAMAILESLEELSLSNQIAGRIGPKTTLLRHGILAATGPQIDPGYNGRLIVNLINLSPRSFSIRYSDPFLSIEFHYLSEVPSKSYSGGYQGRTGLSPEELEILLAYQGPTLAEIYRGFGELRDNIRDIAALRKDFTDMNLDIKKGFSDIKIAVIRPESTTSIFASINEIVEEKYSLFKPIPIILRKEDEEYLASFFEANIHSNGDTDQEAFENLRSLIIDVYESLASTPTPDLGPEPMKQWKILQKYIKKEEE